VWDRPEPEGLVRWTLGSGVGELFVHVGPRLGTSPDLDWVRTVSARARAAGIRVAALGGDPAWVVRPDDALDWQAGALATGLFDGVHLDVEPWRRDDWDTRRAELVAGYLEVHRRLAAATTLPVEADVAFWLHEVESAAGPLDAALMQELESATVMSYRTTATGPDSITAVAERALSTGGNVGIGCRLAVETRYLGDDPVSRKQTFHGLGVAALQCAMVEVDAHHASTAAYRGIAVHDHAGWRSL
jgi:hypothetical protein